MKLKSHLIWLTDVSIRYLDLKFLYYKKMVNFLGCYSVSLLLFRILTVVGYFSWALSLLVEF